MQCCIIEPSFNNLYIYEDHNLFNWVNRCTITPFPTQIIENLHFFQYLSYSLCKIYSKLPQKI